MQSLFAEVKIRITPRYDDKACEGFASWFPEESAIRNIVNMLVTSLKESADGGGLHGYPLWNCSIELCNPSMMAFR